MGAAAANLSGAAAEQQTMKQLCDVGQLLGVQQIRLYLSFSIL